MPCNALKSTIEMCSAKIKVCFYSSATDEFATFSVLLSKKFSVLRTCGFIFQCIGDKILQ